MTTWLRCLFSLSLFLLMWPAAHADISAQLDRPRIAEGETVQLHIQVDGQSADQPDTTPLENDFDVLGTSSSTQMSIINGQMNATTSWQITLSPKHDGTITVPSLQVGNEKTLPLQLEVGHAAPPDDAQGGADVFIETEVAPTSPYVQEKLLYRVQIFYAVPLSQATLSDPQIDNALTQRLGDDRNYVKQRGGRQYKVVERVYAVFPQSSGELTLPGPVLSARAPDTRRQSGFDSFFGRDPFNSFFSNTRPLRIRADDQTIQVQPRPADAKGANWLPAESLEITETWQPENTAIKVGEPLTRTIEIRAKGLTGNQLPDIDLSAQEGLKVYPDNPESSTQALSDSVEGSRTRRYALVGTQAGQFELPAITVRWWDTKARIERTTELPARTIAVAAASPEGSNNTASIPSMPSATQRNNDTQATIPAIQLQEEPIIANGDSGYWRWISVALAILWFTTLLLWWRSQRSSIQSEAEGGAPPRHEIQAQQARKQFHDACSRNDAPAARRALLQWAAAHWPEDPPGGLNELSVRLANPKTSTLLKRLDEALYASEETKWRGEELAQLIVALPQTKNQTPDSTLPALYL